MVDLRELKALLQSRGVRVEAPAEGRRGGAGPSEGISLMLGGMEATVPAAAPFTDRSPILLAGRGGRRALLVEGREVAEAVLPEEPRFQGLRTADGTEMRMLALRHSSACLGTTVLQRCSRSPRCSFCAIDLSLRRGSTTAVKRPAQLAEVAEAAASEGFVHAVLTTGTPAREREGLRHLRDCAEAVRRAGLKVQVQCEPPRDPSLLEELTEVSDGIGIHIESWDQAVREKVTPAKCDRSKEDYLRCWRRAVELWGAGQVSSFLIVGLGESDRSVLQGARILADLGVYPFVLPLRPVPGTPLGQENPPSQGRMIRLYEKVAEVVREAGLRAAEAAAGCVRCGACSCITDFTG